jgi:hypothetical protein
MTAEERQMRDRKPFKSVLGVMVGLLVVGLVASPALADSTYHSTQIALTPVGDAPLRTGFVENIHVNGPNVFAHEIYVVNGAIPSTDFQVTISVWVGNTACTANPSFTLPTATLSTNVAGNGQAQHVFSPADATGLHNTTDGAMWTLSTNGGATYTSRCEVISLD